MKKCKDALSDFRRGERASSAILRVAPAVLGSALLAASLFGCPPRDPGFDLVRVPASAYLALDGAAGEGGVDAGDGGRADGGSGLGLCMPVPDEDDFEASDDFADCPAQHGDDELDVPTTRRHRDKDEALCCYRHTRKVRPRNEE